MDQQDGFYPKVQSAYGSESRRRRYRHAGVTSRLRLAALCAYAKDFLSAARSAQPLRGTCGPARLYLLCQALDLALTAYLVAHGDDAVDDAPETVNDLEALWSDAKSYGLDDLVHLTPTVRTNLRKAASYYSAGATQRPALAEILSGSTGAPEFDPLLRTVTTVVTTVCNVVNTAMFEDFDRASDQ